MQTHLILVILLAHLVMSVRVASERQRELVARIKAKCAGVFTPEAAGSSWRPPATPGSPSTKFVILTRGRSGSTLLVDLLNRHPAIECHGEALSKRDVYANMPGWTLTAREANRSGFLSELYQGYSHPAKHAVGFKVFPQQLTMSEFIGLATSPHVKKIVLRRPNVIDIFVSELKARKLGAYTGVNTSDVKVHVFLTDFRTFVRHLDKEYACIDSVRDESWLSLQYEDVAKDLASGAPTGSTISNMYRFLGLQPVLLRTRSRPPTNGRPSANIGGALIKQDWSLHSQTIDNYAQLTRAFKGTRFESMLRGPRSA